MQEYSIAIGQNGRIVIPTSIRKALDLQAGQCLLLRLENQSIIMEKLTDIALKLQNRLKLARMPFFILWYDKNLYFSGIQ